MSLSLVDRLLTTLDVRLHAFAACEVELGVRLAFEAMDVIVVHFVIAGDGVLQVEDAGDHPISAGDVVIVPPQRGQALIAGRGPIRDVSPSDTSAMLVDGMIRFGMVEGRVGHLRTLCATLTATYGGSFGLFDTMAEPLIEPLTRLPAVASAFEQLMEERAHPDIGTHALTEALMKQCFVLLIRAKLKDGGASGVRLRGMSDPRLATVVQRVLARPGDRHTLPDLAAAAGMSRSAFASAFTATFGDTPMTFVQKTRMHHAAQMLIGSAVPVKVIAASVGFNSRSHFSRSFKRAYGADPSAFRQAQLREGLDAPEHDGRSLMDRLVRRGGDPAG